MILFVRNIRLSEDARFDDMSDRNVWKWRRDWTVKLYEGREVGYLVSSWNQALTVFGIADYLTYFPLHDQVRL